MNGPVDDAHAAAANELLHVVPGYLWESACFGGARCCASGSG